MCLCSSENRKAARISILVIVGVLALSLANGETRPLTSHEVLHLKAAAKNQNITDENPLMKAFGHNRKERCFFSSPSSPSYEASPSMPWKIDPRYQLIDNPRGPAKISTSTWWESMIPPLGLDTYSNY